MRHGEVPPGVVRAGRTPGSRFRSSAAAFSIIAGLATAAGAAAAPARAQFVGTLESGVDRPGADFKTIVLDRPQPSACATLCADNGSCKAYTYVKPDVQGSKATCYLKHTVRPPVKRSCCTSGVKKSALYVVTLEPGRDRPGANYRDATAPVAYPDYCQGVCLSDGKCKAFTYVEPGLQGPKAHCWYKNEKPQAVQSSCCTSGSKVLPEFMMHSVSGEDRPGGDYLGFLLTHAQPAICASMCALDEKCKAYTYVKPRGQGAKAGCWLKDTPAPAIEDDCCVSGVRQKAKPANPGLAGKPLALVFSERTEKEPRTGLYFPADMPAIRWPDFDGCSADDRNEIYEAWALAHFYAWRADQIMQYLSRNSSHRQHLWDYEYINDHGKAPDYDNASMRGWFGPYDGKRFGHIRDSVAKVWNERFRGRTFTVKCRNNAGNRGAHPCYRKIPSTGHYPSANHIVYGTINFCSGWFDERVSLRAKTVVHEIYHWLKVPHSAYWVSDTHDYWIACGRYRTARPLYGELAVYVANFSGCRDRNYERAWRNNDNYALFSYMFGRAVYDGKTVRGLDFTQFPGPDFKW